MSIIKRLSMIDERYRDIIHRYLTGSISPSEEKQLLSWVESSQTNKTFFEACKKFYSARDNYMSHEETEKYWHELKRKIQRHESERESARRLFNYPHTYWKAAAAVVLLTVATILVSKFVSRDSMVSYRNTSNIPVIHYLPDSSIAWLRTGSTISYVPQFERQRAVTLSGEAFFEVRKNPEVPFIVSAQEAEVAVLGTSFNLRAEPNASRIEVTVLTGRVSFRESNNVQSEVVLTAGKGGAYDRNARKIIIQSPDANILSWKTGLLTFEKARLMDVVAILERHYHADIGFEEQLATLRFTGSIRNVSFEDALKIVCLSLNLELKTIEGRVVLASPDRNK